MIVSKDVDDGEAREVVAATAAYQKDAVITVLCRFRNRQQVRSRKTIFNGLLIVSIPCLFLFLEYFCCPYECEWCKA